jgi:hypothetical protein
MVSWWNDYPARWSREEEHMAYLFPGSRWESREIDGVTTRVWTLSVTPTPVHSEQQLLIADLCRDADVHMEPGGD